MTSNVSFLNLEGNNNFNTNTKNFDSNNLIEDIKNNYPHHVLKEMNLFNNTEDLKTNDILIKNFNYNPHNYIRKKKIECDINLLNEKLKIANEYYYNHSIYNKNQDSLRMSSLNLTKSENKLHISSYVKKFLNQAHDQQISENKPLPL